MDKALQGRPTNEMAGQDDNNSDDDYNSDKNNNCAPVDTEIFEVASNQTAVASLSSHINALKRSLLPMAYGVQSSPALPYASETEPGRANYLRNLPSVPQIQSLTRLYFEHLNNFFPCLDDAQFQERLARIEVDQVVSEGDRLCLVVKPSSRSFVMSMCMVLAVATYLDPSSHQGQDNNTAPGWRYVRMAEEMAGRDHHSSSRSVGIDLDLVRYHTVRAMYMIHVERLTAAAHAIGTAIQLAFNAGLNDESTWGSDCSDTDRCARRLLWWTIFYMDRRVAQKCWKPYLIRENEVLVEDVVQMPESSTFGSGVFDDQETYSETEGKVLIHRYVQTAVSWARLWAVVWDTMFAARAPRGESRLEEIEVLDARLLHAQRQIHESLQWETCLLPSYMAAGETEAHIRSRLVACVRMNLLRLLIRQSCKHTVASDPRGSQICMQLASETIEAILAYMKTRTNQIPFGLNAVECVVEAMCHLVPHLKGRSRTAPYLSSFGRAVEFLQGLSNSLGAASRALDALGGIADGEWLNVFDSEGGISLDYMPLSANPISQGFCQESFNELFSEDWAEMCLPGSETALFAQDSAETGTGADTDIYIHA
ncbi:hypothetical protein LTR20_008758 [Exophiala xenobiotica]|nr:hypothetical protein LTR14_002838 [Exophiala xenobiotica]KAK5364822.1 hypothetical protein LTS13_008649 [Exophiala xenobiotica]KAK5392506.1 hypothetical protein LTR79_009972 [Exophiala xenobiotica]KAK5408336.1 hypothetical protein LTR06_007179 [Exophiala xenobiotica]KAK5457407.1 hypothetical protein LTR20_008758 [Exophiala xenobiotica]